ncbi:MAG: TonB-dependent receptor [Porticoccaceae bacterium]|nr:TonB-dependent receptor [Porticoccaceae bacterium]
MKTSHLLRNAIASSCCVLPISCATANDNYDEVVVTATRTPVALVDSLASVSTISRTDIDAQQPVDLVDVFRQVPSLDISSSGGRGSATSLFTRGTASGHTLILVDGQRVSSATLGSANFQFLNPDQIERIEVVRGSHSSLYGSEAIGGVIQIFTRDGSASEGSYVTTAAGSNDLAKVAVGSSGNSGNWRYGIHASYLETDGIDNLEVDTGFNADRDGYRNKSVNASGGYRFDNGADLTLRYLESNNRNEHDSAFNPAEQPYSDSVVQNINLRGRLPVTDVWTTEISLGTATDDSDNYDGITDASDGNFRTRREQLYWQNDFTLAEGQIFTLGYDYYEDEVTSSSNSYVDSHGNPVNTRDNRALFGQYQGTWSIVDVVLGLREDDNQEFGEHTTGNVAVGVKLGDHYKVVASWSEGFKAPTFNDLYWPAGPYSAGNPNLSPEESENSELSLRGDYDSWRWSVAYFQNDVNNLIDWAPGSDFVWRPYNVSDAEIEGGELMVATDLYGWSLDAAYSYVEPRDAETDKLLIKRSRSNLTLNASRSYGDFSLGFSIKAQDERYTDTANSDSLGGYGTLGLRLGYDISRNLKTSLKVDNAFDKDYQLNRGYNQDGRAWQLGLTYSL